jgi:hypothetical protein
LTGNRKRQEGAGQDIAHYMPPVTCFFQLVVHLLKFPASSACELVGDLHSQTITETKNKGTEKQDAE